MKHHSWIFAQLGTSAVASAILSTLLCLSAHGSEAKSAVKAETKSGKATAKPAAKAEAKAAEKPTHWEYEGAAGPENWGKLEASYALCTTGKNQSPVNISTPIEAELPVLDIAYQAGGNEVVNNGHTIQVNYAPGSTLTLDGVVFTLKQFHFHAPSENTFNGKSYPMELHLVHADAEGNLAVIGVMIEEGAWNQQLSRAWAVMLPTEGTAKPKTDVDANGLLPKRRDYYRFSGSLTTPPCSEGVRWLVMKNPITAEKAQIKKFTDTLHHPNNRPVQPLNGRPVLQ